MFGFDVNKLKPNLKMAVHRIGIIKNKKKNATVAARREIAAMLSDDKEEKARIRVEGIIRDDFTIEGYEIIELLCELVAERASLVKTERECPYDMREAVCTLIWAANRTDIQELVEVKKQFTKKYGQDFAAAAVRNVNGCVNERVIQKLSVQPPSAYLVVNYMKEIAKQFKVNWEPDESAIVDPLAPIPAPTGTSIGNAGVSGPEFAALYAAPPPPGSIPSAFPNPPTGSASEVYATMLPPPPTSYAPPPPAASFYQQPPAAPSHTYTPPNQMPPPPAYAPAPAPPPAAAAPAPATDGGLEGVPDFDELTARFERLRKRQDQGSSTTSFTF